ncbi:GNAT family N-acetyltransferase [Streptantibioticus silvisoli]|uniref:GNAT family N-acetyltransferase n=1 Tax=Streptantibioticus silvisoli TaxID=2705255 RepID=A0ABT6VYE0_9ACTN|nr:GNAT family N-acetyltransferase [Streptantibioticus silvisoli]MDI5963508.1 GNAT family N-acetyltransferase [Streptantibioticus silvisoli]
MILRPLRDTRHDAEAVHRVMTAARGGPGPAGDDPADERAVRLRAYVRHLARTDPGGCWVAADDHGRPVGAALATRREGTWGLALLAVPEQDGGPVPPEGPGVGQELLAAALAYGRACLRGIICVSGGPGEAATYRRAGFTLHPAMRLTGPLDRAGLGVPDGAVHEGSPRDRDMMDSVDRRTRGGAHGPDHPELMRHTRLLVADDLAGSGYAYLDPDGTVQLLAATSRRLATRLLTAALLLLPDGAPVRLSHLTAEQEWAVDVGLAAGLELSAHGFVALRGMRPPAPWVPSGTFL